MTYSIFVKKIRLSLWVYKNVYIKVRKSLHDVLNTSLKSKQNFIVLFVIIKITVTKKWFLI